MRSLLRSLVCVCVLCASASAIRAEEKATNELTARKQKTDDVARPGDAKRGNKNAVPKPKRSEVIHTDTPKYKMPLSFYVPSSCTGKERVPLVLSYHGKGGDNAGEIGSWVGLAEKHGFVVACPKSYLAGGVRPASDKRPLGPIREVEDALAVVEMLKGKYRIDDRFIMATGFSGGGLPAYASGLLHPDVFRYVCSRSGNFPDSLISTARQQASTQPQITQSIGEAVKNSHFYFFYGEHDHPVILKQDAPLQTGFFEGNKAPHFKKERVPGMGHDGRPSLAAEWFVNEIKAALAQPEAKGGSTRLHANRY